VVLGTQEPSSERLEVLEETWRLGLHDAGDLVEDHPKLLLGAGRRASITAKWRAWLSQDVLWTARSSEAGAAPGDSSLTRNGTPSPSIPSSEAALTWNSSSCSTIESTFSAHRLERRRHTEADVGEAHACRQASG
jgi:hypothetical protein